DNPSQQAPVSAASASASAQCPPSGPNTARALLSGSQTSLPIGNVPAPEPATSCRALRGTGRLHGAALPARATGLDAQSAFRRRPAPVQLPTPLILRRQHS